MGARWLRLRAVPLILALCFVATSLVWLQSHTVTRTRLNVETVTRVTHDGPRPLYRDDEWVWDKQRADSAVMCRFAAESCPRDSAGWTWIPRLPCVPNRTVHLSRCLQNKRVVFVGEGATYDQLVSLACLLPETAPLCTTSQFESFFAARDNITVTFVPASFLLDASRNKHKRNRVAEELTSYDVIVVGALDLWWGANVEDGHTLHEDRAQTWRMVTDAVPLLAGLAVGRSIVWRSSTPPPCSGQTTERMKAQLDQLNAALLHALSENRVPLLYLNVTSLTNAWANRTNHQGSIENCRHWCIPGVPDVWNEMLLAVLCDECVPQVSLPPVTFPKNSPIERALAQFLLGHKIPELEYYGLEKSKTALEDIKRKRIALSTRSETKLRFPMDWTQYPRRSRTFRMKLHSLAPVVQTSGTIYLDLSQNASTRHEAANIAKLVCLDWIKQNRVDNSNRTIWCATSDMVWCDMTVGLRIGSLLLGLRMALSEELLSSKELTRWLKSLREHAMWLMNDVHYRFHHNHGIFEDIGLFQLSQDLIMLPEAAWWEQRSRSRCRDNFSACVGWDEGIWLEHSAMYQLMMVNIIRRTISIGLGSTEFVQLERLMSENLQWFNLPDGRLVALGDTTPGPYHKVLGGPRKTVHDALKVFWQAGLGVARAYPHSMLHLISWFHSGAHKHLDDLSISLFDLGERLLVHPGVFGYVSGPGSAFRLYAQSAASNNGLQVDDDLHRGRNEIMYGCGLVGSGWRERGSSSDPPSFALEGQNPRVRHTKGVTHHRTIYYHPMHTLVIVDRVRATKPHLYTRYLHFGPAVRLRCTGNSVFDMIIVGHNDTQPPRVMESSTGDVSVSRVRGRRKPAVQGFVFPTGMEPQLPVDTLVMSCTATNAILVVWFDLEGTRAPRVRLDRVHIDQKGTRTELLWTDGQSVTLERQGSTFHITESSDAG